MAGVRASVMKQAQLAASGLGSRPASAVDERVLDQLVRCARLSPDAELTLERALHTLAAHGTRASDQVACQLLAAARDRLQMRVAANRGRVAQKSLTP